MVSDGLCERHPRLSLSQGREAHGDLVPVCGRGRCAQEQVTVTTRTPDPRGGARWETTRTFRTFYGELRAMARWLVAERGVTHVAMESTRVYWRPVVRHEVPRDRAEVKGLRLRPVAAGR